MQVEQMIVFKFLLIGDYSVGKSAFLNKYVDNSFSEQYIPTVGIDFKMKHLELNGKYSTLNEIWDTAGQERFRTLTSSYYKGANGIFIIYDITNKESFNNVSQWQEQAQKLGNPDALKILVGNKSDLNGAREVTVEEGQQLASASGIPFIEISAKEEFNVEHAINTLLIEALAQYEKKQKEQQPEKQ